MPMRRFPAAGCARRRHHRRSQDAPAASVSKPAMQRTPWSCRSRWAQQAADGAALQRNGSPHGLCRRIFIGARFSTELQVALF
jgi:hypothetical protein